MPASRLEQLRLLAERHGVPPSTLMRRWVIERMDEEAADEDSADPRVQRAVRMELDRIGLTADLIETLRSSMAEGKVGAAKGRRKAASQDGAPAS